MPQLNVKIQGLADTGKGEPFMQGFDPAAAIEASSTTCVILEGGTKSGQTVLMFISEGPDKAFTFFQITAELFNALIGAFWGAQIRFQQPIADHLTASMGGQEQQQKLLDAGFKIYRFSWYEGSGGKITYCHHPGAWRLFEGGFSTKSALLRRKKELLQDAKALEG